MLGVNAHRYEYKIFSQHLIKMKDIWKVINAYSVDQNNLYLLKNFFT